MYGWVKEIQHHISKQGSKLELVRGLIDGRALAAKEAGEDFLYLDHAYFNRDWDNAHFRLIRRGIHLTEVKPRPSDRMAKWHAVILPWKKIGRAIAVVPPSHYIAQYHGLDQLAVPAWFERTRERLDAVTGRPVIVRPKGGPLVPWLAEHDVWAVVTYCSVAGVEAAMAGYPVFSTPQCPSWPVNAGPLEKIDAPEYPEREPWAASLSYACWCVADLPKMKLKDWDYECLG